MSSTDRTLTRAKHATGAWLHAHGFGLTGRGGLKDIESYALRRSRLPERVTEVRRGRVLFRVDLHRVTTACGFSYHDDGWHPYLATLRQVVERGDLTYADTALARYYEAFRPRSVQEALLPEVRSPLAPIAAWPPLKLLLRHLWSLTPRQVARLLHSPTGPPARSQHVGPQDETVGAFHLRRIVDAWHGVRTTGYRPADFPDGPLAGYFLLADDDYRFVVLDGNHRLPSLAQLQVRRPLATLVRGHPATIRDTEPVASAGLANAIPPAVGQLLFDTLFAEHGRHKAALLGLD